MPGANGPPSGRPERAGPEQAGREQGGREQAGPEEGGAIVVAAWLADGLFAVTAVPAALGVSAMDVPALAVSVTLFVVSLGVWAYAFGLGVVRSARGDDVAVANLFLLQDSAPPGVRRHLFGALAASIVIALATGFRAPAGFMVPMLPLGLAGMWAARHGTFPPRGVAPGRKTRSNVARDERRSGGRAGE
jgi:hypothetical protein